MGILTEYEVRDNILRQMHTNSQYTMHRCFSYKYVSLGKAFRRLARKYHPDRNLASREAEAKFKKIKEASYELEDGEGQDRGYALHATPYDRRGGSYHGRRKIHGFYER